MSWQELDLSDVGRDLCVTGIVKSAYDSGEAFFVTLGAAPDAFSILSYDWMFPDVAPGMCVAVEGTIEQLGSAPVYQVHYQDAVYGCE